MVKKEPDRLDLKLAEIEAKKATEIRQIVVQDCLDPAVRNTLTAHTSNPPNSANTSEAS